MKIFLGNLLYWRINNVQVSQIETPKEKTRSGGNFKNWVVYRSQHKFLVAVLGVITNEERQVLLLKHVYRDQPW